jgi:hypothetical protein
MEEEQATYHQLRLRVEAARQAENVTNQKVVSSSFPIDAIDYRRRQLAEQQQIQAIITSVAEAKAAEEMAAALEADEKKAKAEVVAAKKKVDKEKEKERKHKKTTPQERANKEANKEKRLLKLVGAIVVKSMSKYVKGLGKEDFKKHAKEVSCSLI